VLGGWDGAAARLGLSRTTLISRMQRLGISATSGTSTVGNQSPISRLQIVRGDRVSSVMTSRKERIASSL